MQQQQDLLIGNVIPSEQYLRRCIKNIANELELIEEEIENIDKSNTVQLGKLLTRRKSFIEIIEDTYKDIMKYYPETHYPQLQKHQPVIINDEVVVSCNKEVLCINPLSDLQKNGIDTTKFIKKEVRSACRFVELMCHLSIGKVSYNKFLEMFEINTNINTNNDIYNLANPELDENSEEAIIINEEVVVSCNNGILCINPLSDLHNKGVDISNFKYLFIRSARRFVELMCHLSIGKATYNEVLEMYDTDDGIDGYHSGALSDKDDDDDDDDEDQPQESVIIDNEVVVNFNPLSILQQKRGEVFKFGENNIGIMNNTKCNQNSGSCEEQAQPPESIIIDNEVVVSFKDDILSIQPLKHLQKKGVDTSKFGNIKIGNFHAFNDILRCLAIGEVEYREILQYLK